MKLGKNSGTLRKNLRKWYTKPRKGFIFGLSNFILNDPKAFQILMMMARIFGTLFVGIWLFISFIYDFGGVIKTLLLMLFLVSLYKLIQHIKISIKNKDVWVDLTVGDVLRKNNGGKIK